MGVLHRRIGGLLVAIEPVRPGWHARRAERAEDGGRGPRAVLHGTAPLVIDAARNLAGHAHPEMA